MRRYNFKTLHLRNHHHAPNAMLRQKDGFQGSRLIVLPQLIINMLEKDALTSSLHLTDIGYFPRAYNHYREREVPINQHIFIYCVNGAGWYELDGLRQEVKANHYFMLPANQLHSYGSSKNNPWTIYWIHFKGSLAPLYAKHAVRPMEIQPSKNSHISTRIDIFEEIYKTLKSGYAQDNLYYVSSLLHYFFGSLLNIQQFRTSKEDADSEKSALQNAIHYMKENIEKPLTLEAIAQYAGYSISHFSLLFKQLTGHAPLAYFNLLKVQQACFLLDSTDMKINQICFKVGVEDSFYFSRLFNKIMGVSPREYKKQRKG